MPKRFTDTEKWKDIWFEELSPQAKMMYFFYLDHCDCAGVWKGSFKQVEFFTGFKYSKKEFLSDFGEKITQLNNGSFFMPNFIKFQYGKLSKTNNAHIGVIKALNYNGIETSPYIAPSKLHYSGAQDKDKDKDKVKDKDKEKNEKAEVITYCEKLVELFDDDDIIAWIKSGNNKKQQLKLFKRYNQAFLIEEIENAYAWQAENKKRGSGTFLAGWLERCNKPDSEKFNNEYKNELIMQKLEEI